MSSRRSAAALALLAVAGTARALPAEPPAPLFEPERVEWTRARLGASKLFLSMQATLETSRLSPATAEALLLDAPTGGALQPRDGLLSLRMESRGLGRHSSVQVLMDPDSGTALQRTARDTGKRLRLRSYRFTTSGAYRRTREPGPGEDRLPPESWSASSAELRAYPEPVPGRGVMEAGSLIWLAAASPLARAGERLELLAFATDDDELYRVEITALEPETVEVSYNLVAGDARSRHRDRVRAVRLSIGGRPLRPAGGDRDFELLGLRDLELLLDPLTRAPLRLSGRVEFFGRVTFELESLTLAP